MIPTAMAAFELFPLSFSDEQRGQSEIMALDTDQQQVSKLLEATYWFQMLICYHRFPFNSST